jgi:hypothetical protein
MVHMSVSQHDRIILTPPPQCRREKLGLFFGMAQPSAAGEEKARVNRSAVDKSFELSLRQH